MVWTPLLWISSSWWWSLHLSWPVSLIYCMSRDCVVWNMCLLQWPVLHIVFLSICEITRRSYRKGWITILLLLVPIKCSYRDNINLCFSKTIILLRPFLSPTYFCWYVSKAEQASPACLSLGGQSEAAGEVCLVSSRAGGWVNRKAFPGLTRKLDKIVFMV